MCDPASEQAVGESAAVRDDRAAPARSSTARARGLKAQLSAFANDKSGDVLVMYGLTMMATFMFVGAAVDLGRWINARSNTMDAIDAAVLAAGRALQTGASQADAKALAVQYYELNTRSRTPVMNDTVSFEVRNNNTTVAATGSAYIKTPFMSLAAVEKLPLFVASEAPEAQTAIDSSSTFNREVALMLDVSGSMCMPCTKRDAMKAAAKDLVEIMMLNNGKSTYWSKIAVVPFSGDVRPPAALFGSVTDPAWPVERSYTETTGGKKKTTVTVKYPRTSCVAERTGDNKYSDAAPGAGNYVMSIYSSDGSCSSKANAEMMPLSLDKAAILAKIAGLTTGSGTAGHLGTAWSYYFLSPKWNAVLPAASQASAYKTAKLKKIAILMTDGEYNQEYDNKGVDVGDKHGGTSANDATSAAQAVALCADMKKNGIEVFTVGFDLPNAAAIDTVNRCASDATKAYTVATGEQLRAAFRDIAIRTTELHLAK